MTANTPSRGRPKRDRRVRLQEVPTDRRDLRKLALAVLAIARARVVRDASEQTERSTPEAEDTP